MAEAVATVQPGVAAAAQTPREVVISPTITTVSARLHEFIGMRMESFKCSAHDAAHVYRVANLTVQIAAKVLFVLSSLFLRSLNLHSATLIYIHRNLYLPPSLPPFLPPILPPLISSLPPSIHSS